MLGLIAYPRTDVVRWDPRLTKDHHDFVLLKVYCLYQALRICLEWSSEAIFFSTHQSKVIHNKITFFFLSRVNSLLAKSLRIFFWRTLSYFCWHWRFCFSKNLVFRFTSRKNSLLHSISNVFRFENTYFDQINFCEQNLRMIENIFFISVKID